MSKIFEDYQGLAMTTRNKKLTGTMTLVNVGLGLSGELAELFEIIDANVKTVEIEKELGDVFWYVALGFDSIGLKMEDHLKDAKLQQLKDVRTSPTERTVAKNRLDIIVCSGKIADSIKKISCQGHAMKDHNIEPFLVELINHLFFLCEMLVVDVEKILQMNVDKLKARYPQGFETAKSISREEHKLSVLEERLIQHNELCKDMHDLYAVKNAKYNDSFAKTFAEYDMCGNGAALLCVRLDDKVSRAKAILLNGELGTVDESIKDTLVDLANYSIMSVMALESKLGHKIHVSYQELVK